MSKNSDGPSANSFDSPRKVGWLHKHGGSGVSSHWKKRWFIVDHHYMFYYKGPNEKKPVGILCLPEYQSCHKAESKDSKKPNSFVLDKGNEDSSDSSGPLKNYVLCTDSEEEMRAWISAITEEIKPMIGSNIYSKGGGKKVDAVKVDEKAFDEVAAMASEGPKLTHITASRPKMKGRRPPKRYQVFHEDEDTQDSPPSTPIKPLPPSPSTGSSPSSSPAMAKKGSRPSAPMLPSKSPLTPPTKQRSATAMDQGGEAAELTTSTSSAAARPAFSKPQPPRKPNKPAGSTSPTLDSSIESTPATKEEVTKQPPLKPTPQKKPRTSFGSSPPQTVTAILTDTPNDTKPHPTTAPAPPQKPKPPKTRQRPSLPSEPSMELSATSPEPPTPTKKPTPAARPVPVPRKLTSSAAMKQEESKEESKEASEEAETLAEEEPVGPEVLEMKEEDMTAGGDRELASGEPIVKPNVSPDHSKEEEESKEKRKSVESEKSEKSDVAPTPPLKPMQSTPSMEASESSLPTQQTEQEAEKISLQEQEDGQEELYEDMGALNGVTSGSTDEMYELVDYDQSSKSNKRDEDTEQEADLDVESKSQKNGISVEVTSADTEKQEDYEEMDVTGKPNVDEEEEEDTHDYEKPDVWSESSPVGSRHSSVGFVPTGLATDMSKGNGIYDVPRRIYANGDQPPSTVSASTGPGEILGADLRPPQSPEVGRRSHSLSSSGSVSSVHSDMMNLSLQARKGSKARESLSSSSRSNSLGMADGEQGRRLNSFEKRERSDSSSDYSVPGTLQQAKEILRLARAMKAEAEQMKEEAYRELELARRERHDASLLKKNAAEILKIAKYKLVK